MEKKGFWAGLKEAVSDQGWSAAKVDPTDKSISVWVAHRDGTVTNLEKFKRRNPLKVFWARRVLATAGAFALRGTALLEMGATGASIARGIRHKSVPEVFFSATVGGAAVAATEVGSEACRLVVRSLKAREVKVNVLFEESTSVPQEPRPQS